MRALLVSIFVMASSLFSPSPAMATPPAPVGLYKSVPQIVREFVSKHSQNEFAYRLTADEFQRAFDESNGRTDAVFNAQASKVLKRMSQPKDSLERFHRLQAEQALQIEAHQLVDQLINDVSRGHRPITDLNMLLITLAHDYVFDSENAGPLDYLIHAINDYHFSEDQIRDLRMKSNNEY